MTGSGYTKRALIRPEGFPVGQPAPFMLLNCECGRQNRVERGEGVDCDCGIKYNATGWITSRPVEA